MSTSPPNPDLEFVEIYASHNLPDAQILQDVFTSHGIEVMTRTIQVAPIPMSTGKNGEHRIAVESDRVEEALDLIQQALTDGAILAKDAEILVMTAGPGIMP